MTRPSVSVVIPCYGYAHFLESAVRSALDQDGVDVSVLVIDDASPDGTPAVAAALAESDPRVTWRRHATNAGHIATYNEGLAWAEGDATVLLSADDLLVPGALRRGAEVLAERPAVGFVYGRSVRFSTDRPPPAPRTRPTGVTVWDGHAWLAGRARDGHNVISSPEVMVRTALQHRLGGYRADLPHTADLEMWLRFAAHADVAYVRGADQAYYRVHNGSMLRSQPDVWLSDLRHRKRAWDAVFDAEGARLPDADRWRAAADRAMAREALWIACRAYDRRRTTTLPVEAFVDFALATYPDARRLGEWRGLTWRRAVGPRVCPLLQPLLWTAVYRRARSWWWWQSWKRRGV